MINKLKANNDATVMADIKTIITNLDPTKKDANNNPIGQVMRDFVKISDGSIFF